MSVAEELEVSLDIRKRIAGESSDQDGMKQRNRGDTQDIAIFEKSS